MLSEIDERRHVADLVLVAGANPAHWPIVRNVLEGRWTSAFAVDLRGVLDVIARDRASLLLLCSDLLDASARRCLDRVRAHHPNLPVIALDACDVDGDVVGLPERGIADGLAAAVEQTLAARRVERDAERAAMPANRPLVMGTSPAFRKVIDTLRRVARADVTVLLCGETGCGKELLARRLHCTSERARGPFRAVSLPAIPKELFESALFGHERGAFTGAVTDSDGAFGQAHGGTLFLDEISSVTLECQAKLLRAIQEREVERVGGREPVSCDLRIVAATNVDLRGAVAAQEFRDDLYHRLSVVTVEIPPLRRRPDDIPALVQFFLRKFSRKFRREAPSVAPEAMAALTRHAWTGNVRELENRVQRALLLSAEDTLCAHDFFGEPGDAPSGADIDFDSCTQTLAEVERAYIARVVEHTGGNQSRAAEILAIDRKTLRAKLRKNTERFGCVRAPDRRAGAQAG